MFFICKWIFLTSMLCTVCMLQDWYSRQKFLILVVALNVSLAAVFWHLLTTSWLLATFVSLFLCHSDSTSAPSYLRQGRYLAVCWFGSRITRMQAEIFRKKFQTWFSLEVIKFWWQTVMPPGKYKNCWIDCFWYSLGAAFTSWRRFTVSDCPSS